MIADADQAFADFFARGGIAAEPLAQKEAFALIEALKDRLGVGLTTLSGTWSHRGVRAESAYALVAARTFVLLSPRAGVPAYRCQGERLPHIDDLRRFLWWLKGNWGEELGHGPLDLAVAAPNGDWVLLVTAEDDIHPLFAQA